MLFAFLPFHYSFIFLIISDATPYFLLVLEIFMPFKNTVMSPTAKVFFLNLLYTYKGKFLWQSFKHIILIMFKTPSTLKFLI